MLDDFFVRALIAGIGIALVAAPLGCLIIWRKMAYFGDTLAHSALLGVALAFLFEVNLTLAVFAVSAFISICLITLQKRALLPSDALLGLLSHSALAIGLVTIAFMSWLRIDLMGYLIGDILSVSKTDILIVFLGGLAVLVILKLIWQTLFASTLNEELAIAENLNPNRANFIFMILIAVVIAISIKIVGVLLITALLIIPAACARRFAATPEQMALIAAPIGVLSVVSGLMGSLQFDTPSGPSIVIASLLLFLVSLLPIFKWLNTDAKMKSNGG